MNGDHGGFGGGEEGWGDQTWTGGDGRAIVRTVTGIAGAGKTSYAMSILEQKLREGLQWSQIGFCSFSRAACQEGAQRAAEVCGVDSEALTKTGWFRTLHSAALRLSGVPREALLDPESPKTAEWFREAGLGSPGGERGTDGEFCATALAFWDLLRARVVPILDMRSDTDDRRDDSVVSSLKPCVFCGQTHGDDTDDTMMTPKFRLCHHLNSKRRNDLRGNFSFLEYYKEIFYFLHDKLSAQKMVSSVIISNKSLYSKELSDDTLGQESVISVITLDRIIEEAKRNPLCGKALCQTSANTARMIRETVVSSLWDGWNAKEVGGWSTDTVRKYISEYETKKVLYGKVDFTDLMFRMAGLRVNSELAVVPAEPCVAPSEVKVWILDEYQDCSPLLDHAVQALTRHAAEVWMLGDSHQAVYGFSGSSSLCYRMRELAAEQDGTALLLNRSWRNPEQVLDWGEQVLREGYDYEERRPISESDEGSVGLLDWDAFVRLLPLLATTDTMILGRTWWNLQRVKSELDQQAIPWASCQEKQSSRWEAPVRIALTLTFRDLLAGKLISEQDWRRVTENYPQKLSGQELFARGIKAKWKKMECGREPRIGIGGLEEVGATDFFVREFLRGGLWKTDTLLLMDQAIDRFGIEHVRKPGIRIGSVHSVKGLEADNVFVIAESTVRASGIDALEEEERCLKYVAITRAKRHYRLVVDQVSVGRGRPQFWAAPKGFWEFTNEGSGDSEKDQAVFGRPRSDGGQVPSELLQSEGISRSDRHLQRKGDLPGNQGAGRGVDDTAEGNLASDIECWWNF